MACFRQKCLKFCDLTGYSTSEGNGSEGPERSGRLLEQSCLFTGLDRRMPSPFVIIPLLFAENELASALILAILLAFIVLLLRLIIRLIIRVDRNASRCPLAVEAALAKLNPAMQSCLNCDFTNRIKLLVVAYITWLFLSWHYLYLGKIGLQFAFWFTAGGLFIWWVIDLFRMPGVVARHNEDLARELMGQYWTLAQMSA